MKNILLLFILFTGPLLIAQEEILPKGPSEAEKALESWIEFVDPPVGPFSITGPPPEPVRHMAEWEELEALVITWRSFPEILREIVRHAKEEVRVIIVVRNTSVENQAKNELTGNGITLDNVEFLIADNNSVWTRDFGPNTVYANEVEDQYFIDWVYNRINRPEDDLVPDAIGEYLQIPVYSTSTAPYRMVNTGGNFLSDGLGTGFASKLILEENEPGNIFGAGPHDEPAIDNIMNLFMGIEPYVKFETLPFDGIHHIDMHMKLLDEETILFGEYPPGVADGPQIEANIQYLINNFESAFGEPYKIERILMPPDFNGSYPNSGGNYRTYTNSVLINKTILVPTYQEQYDTTALRIYEELHPGYKVVGINCNDMIWALGALHCITKEVGVQNPLWIVHQKQRNIDINNSVDDYEQTATIKHNSGIAEATLYWTTDLSNGYEPVEMTMVDPLTDTWSGSIPHQENGTEIFYYIHAIANSSKELSRPLAAPEGYYNFTVNDMATPAVERHTTTLQNIYPNPASAITVIPVSVSKNINASIEIYDAMGRLQKVIFEGEMQAGDANYFINAQEFVSGTYFVQLKTQEQTYNQKLIIK